AAYRRIDELLQTRDDIKDEGVDRTLGRAEIRIDIQQFSYTGSAQPALEDIHLQVPAGTTLALVGHTGSGKSTLINLLLRLYDGKGVDIALNGDNIRSFSLDSLRRNIAFVPQDPLLFSATIAENIALGKPDARQEEIEQAARLAHIHEDILRFPDGYDTIVGERGVTLSGGQKQRISIARALLLDAPILILDDALSAVDMETERQILGHLRQARVGRTTVIVCHRLSAVEDAEQIAVLSHGHLAELGQHQQLQSQGGWYARMVEYQKLEQAVHEGRSFIDQPVHRQLIRRAPPCAGPPAGLRLALPKPVVEGAHPVADRYCGRCQRPHPDQSLHRRLPDAPTVSRYDAGPAGRRLYPAVPDQRPDQLPPEPAVQRDRPAGDRELAQRPLPPCAAPAGELL